MWPILMNPAKVADAEWQGDKKKTLFLFQRLQLRALK